MAKTKATTTANNKRYNNKRKAVTSIGRSKNSRPKNKNKRKNHKKYRGQGN